MKVCAVNGCGETRDLHEHHISPVVYDPQGRRKRKVKGDVVPFDKRLGDCNFAEVFAYIFTLGCMSSEDTITVCSHHHRILHGILAFNKASHSKMVREGIEKARQSGKFIGRPTNLTTDVVSGIIADRKKKMPIRAIGKKYRVGTGTVYRVLGIDKSQSKYVKVVD
jgi:hypothetical protein